MSISPGERFGSYEIDCGIGAGGMGEVFRAKDTRLKRDVALKLLPQAFLDDLDRLARFRREAELLAALNHPNIAQVYDLEQADGQTAIVMELVEGPTLAERLEQGPIPPEDAMAIAVQVVAALEAAHQKGIVHRDLKPANIKVRPDGTVKVLDFGISKPIDPRTISGGAPALTTPAMTETGVILGTAAYMSPEQARGKFVDERTDIWAFGCLLFEMLTGQPAFGGEDVMLTLARVLDRDTDLSSIPKSISPAVRRTIRLCLQKDPRKRIADIRDVRLALEGGFEIGLPGGVAAAGARSRWSRALLPVATAVAAVVVTAIAAFTLWPERDTSITEFPISLAGLRNIPQTVVLALSPDGQRVVLAVNNQLYLRHMGQREVTPMPGTDGARQPFFSFDGEEVAFFTASQLQAVGFSGVAPRLIAEIPGELGLAGSWDEHGQIYFSQSGISGISRVSALGGVPERFADREDYYDIDFPVALPDSDWVLFLAAATDRGDTDIVALNRSTGDRHLVIEDGAYARYVESGFLLFERGGSLFAVRFDPDRAKVTGDAVPIVPGIDSSGGSLASYAVASNGTLIYVPGQETSEVFSSRLVFVDMNGNVSPSPLVADLRDYGGLRASPDGSKIAVEVGSVESGGVHIFVVDLANDTFQQLSTDGTENFSPVWTPDGLEVLFSSNRGGDGRAIYRRAANGSTAEVLVWEGTNRLIPTDVLPGNVLLFNDTGANGSRDIFSLDLAGDGSATPFADSNEIDFYGRASRDGAWVAYSRSASDSGHLFLRPFPRERGAEKVLSDGVQPLWPTGADRVFFTSWSFGGVPSLVAAPLQYSATTVTPGRLQRIFAFEDVGRQGSRPNGILRGYGHDYLSRDGIEGFVVNQLQGTEQEAELPTEIVVMLNFVQSLRERVPID